MFSTCKGQEEERRKRSRAWPLGRYSPAMGMSEEICITGGIPKGLSQLSRDIHTAMSVDGGWFVRGLLTFKRKAQSTIGSKPTSAVEPVGGGRGREVHELHANPPWKEDTKGEHLALARFSLHLMRMWT